ncbi:hypothetical protein [Streptomyces sp. NPDC003032]
MKLLILVDRNARQLMLQRCSDEETGERVYDVRGFHGSRANYITAWKLDETLGIEAGHYLCDLIPDVPDGLRLHRHRALHRLERRDGPARQEAGAAAPMSRLGQEIGETERAAQPPRTTA